MVAWDPVGKAVVKNTSFQAYAITDTSFTTPLTITDPFGAAIPGNILNSGTQGVFIQFQHATQDAVVIADATKTYTWTIPAIQQDAAVAAYINRAGSATQTALTATFVPKWKATTAYLAGDKVLNPSGDVVSAKVNFTSGASYSASNWTGSSTYDTPRKNRAVLFGNSIE